MIIPKKEFEKWGKAIKNLEEVDFSKLKEINLDNIKLTKENIEEFLNYHNAYYSVFN